MEMENNKLQGEGKQSVSMNQEGESSGQDVIDPKSKDKKKVAIIASVVIVTLIILSVGGYFILLQGKQSKGRTQPQSILENPSPTLITTKTNTSPSLGPAATQQSVVIYPKIWTTFKSKLLNIGFEYPSEWGEALESMREATEKETWLSESKSGKIYTLIFSNKTELGLSQSGTTELPYVGAYSLSTVYVQGFSNKLKPSCPGECCYIYKGDINKPAGIEISYNNYSITDACCQANVGTQCQQKDHLNGSIYFNLPNSEIDGVQLVIPTLSEEDKRKVQNLIKEEGVCKSDSKFESCSENYFINAGATQIKLEKMLKQKEGLDEKSLIYMQIFEKISQSAKIY